MPLFGRKKGPNVSISYMGDGPKVPLVPTPGGPMPLQELVDWGWVSIGAQARWGYQEYGRGAVFFDGESGSMTYRPATHFPENIPAEASTACAIYDPDLQVVLVTKIVHARGFKRTPELFVAALTARAQGLAPSDLAPRQYQFLEGKDG
jgi:hypothetical protein